MSDRPLERYEEEALARGRRPLPQYPGDRPSASTVAAPNASEDAAEESSGDSESPSGSASSTDTNPAADAAAAAASTTGNATLSSSAMAPAATGSAPLAPIAPVGVTTVAAQAAVAPATGYRYWSDADLRRLIILKRQNLPWEDIQNEFPGRTVEGFRQTFFKRRGRIERLMDQEAAERAASSGSTTTGAGPDGQLGQAVEAQQTDGGSQEVSGGQDGRGDQLSSGEQDPENGEEITEG